MESIVSYRFGALIIALLFVLPGFALAKPAVPSWRDSHPWSTEIATVRVGGVELHAEIADTPQLQQRGLGYRDGLPLDGAMIFVFNDASVQTFWMKGMRFCLDIIWIEGGQIVGAAERVCPMPTVNSAELPRYSSEVPVRYVLEVEAGWMDLNGVDADTPVEIILPDSQPD